MPFADGKLDGLITDLAEFCRLFLFAVQFEEGHERLEGGSSRGRRIHEAFDKTIQSFPVIWSLPHLSLLPGPFKK